MYGSRRGIAEAAGAPGRARVFEAAAAGDAGAAAIADEACDALGAMIGTVVNGLNPEVVVVTGGVAASYAEREARVRAAAARHSLAIALAGTRIVITPGDKRMTVRGAAALATLRDGGTGPLSAPVAILTPAGPPAPRGNATTVERLTRGLAERGVEARVWDVGALGEADIVRGVEAQAPRLVHAFHAWRTGPLALGLTAQLLRPAGRHADRHRRQPRPPRGHPRRDGATGAQRRRGGDGLPRLDRGPGHRGAARAGRGAWWRSRRRCVSTGANRCSGRPHFRCRPTVCCWWPRTGSAR